MFLMLVWRREEAEFVLHPKELRGCARRPYVVLGIQISHKQDKYLHLQTISNSILIYRFITIPITYITEIFQKLRR